MNDIQEDSHIIAMDSAHYSQRRHSSTSEEEISIQIQREIDPANQSPSQNDREEMENGSSYSSEVRLIIPASKATSKAISPTKSSAPTQSVPSSFASLFSLNRSSKSLVLDSPLEDVKEENEENDANDESGPRGRRASLPGQVIPVRPDERLAYKHGRSLSDMNNMKDVNDVNSKMVGVWSAARVRHGEGEEDYTGSLRSVGSDSKVTQSDSEIATKLRYTGSLTSSGK